MAVFSRNATTGALTFVETQFDGRGGVDGLRGAWSVAISPDGVHVYVAGRYDGAVAAFRRDASTGRLVFIGAQFDKIDIANGLRGAWSVTVSPDGASVYVGASQDNALTVFQRDAHTGGLAFVEAQRDGAGGVNGLRGAGGVAVSPDGADVYIAGSQDDAVAVFRVGEPAVRVIDAFKCYTMTSSKGPRDFATTDVPLEDQFGSTVARVVQPQTICTPANENREGIVDPNTHLEGYKIVMNETAPAAAAPQTLRVLNQFGEAFVRVKQPQRLLVPTARGLQAPPFPPDPGSHNVDHYQCYEVRVARTPLCRADAPANSLGDCRQEEACGGTSGVTSFCLAPPPFSTGKRVVIEDQPAASVAFNIIKPSQVCTAVNAYGVAIKNPDVHLACYLLRRAKRRCAAAAPQNGGGGCTREPACGGQTGVTNVCVRQPCFQPDAAVQLNNEFGPEVADLKKEDALCVPSTIQWPAESVQNQRHVTGGSAQPASAPAVRAAEQSCSRPR